MNFNYNDYHNADSIKKFIKFIAVLVIIITLIPIVKIFRSQSSGSDKRYKEYTFPVYAEIVDITTEDADGNAIEESPVFQYEYNGQKYRVTVLGIEEDYYSKGQMVEIKLDPSQPSRFYDPSYKKENSNNVIKIGFIVFLLIALIPVILTVCRVSKLLKNADTIAETIAEGLADSTEAQNEAVQRGETSDNYSDSYDSYNYGAEDYNNSYDPSDYGTDDFGDSSYGTHNEDYQRSYDSSYDSYETPKKRRGFTVVRTDNNSPARNILAIIVCLIFIAVGLFVVSIGKNDKKQCTEPVYATVSDIVISTSGSKNKSTSYYPVYSFEYENRTYEVKSNVSSPKTKKLRVGEKVKIYIDPDNPNHVYLAGDSSSSILGYVFAGMGAIILVLVIKTSGFIKRKRTDDGNDTGY